MFTHSLTHVHITLHFCVVVWFLLQIDTPFHLCVLGSSLFYDVLDVKVSSDCELRNASRHTSPTVCSWGLFVLWCAERESVLTGTFQHFHAVVTAIRSCQVSASLLRKTRQGSFWNTPFLQWECYQCSWYYHHCYLSIPYLHCIRKSATGV